jgi:hypothetical protein
VLQTRSLHSLVLPPAKAGGSHQIHTNYTRIAYYAEDNYYSEIGDWVKLDLQSIQHLVGQVTP